MATVLKVRPDGPITNEDVATLSRTADDYLATHPTIVGVIVHALSFPGFAGVSAFADYVRFIADHHTHVRRLALVTNSALAPIAEFVANHMAGLEMRPFPFAEEAAALAWLRDLSGSGALVTAQFLPGIPIQLVRKAYEAAPGNEIESGKFGSPESSAALVANIFGFFLDRPTELPLPRATPEWSWPPISVQLEAVVRFPWTEAATPAWTFWSGP